MPTGIFVYKVNIFNCIVYMWIRGNSASYGIHMKGGNNMWSTEMTSIVMSHLRNGMYYQELLDASMEDAFGRLAWAKNIVDNVSISNVDEFEGALLHALHITQNMKEIIRQIPGFVEYLRDVERLVVWPAFIF